MKSYHIGTLLRLFIPEVLDNINKVIYLDCDVIVTLDIAELWEIDLEDYPLAACPDPDFPRSLGLKYYIPKIKKLYHHLLPRTPYFNAGVLILNLKSMRENTLLSLFASKYLEKFPYAPFSDQDVLNAYCKGKYIKLDKKYNIFSNQVLDTDIGDCCIHYCSLKKPWIVYSGKIDDQYWNYFHLTPWADNFKELVTYIRQAPDLTYMDRFKLDSLRYQTRIILNLLGMTLNNCYNEFRKFLSYL